MRTRWSALIKEQLTKWQQPAPAADGQLERRLDSGEAQPQPRPPYQPALDALNVLGNTAW
jgi:hypothetical protein